MTLCLTRLMILFDVVFDDTFLRCLMTVVDVFDIMLIMFDVFDALNVFDASDVLYWRPV